MCRVPQCDRGKVDVCSMLIAVRGTDYLFAPLGAGGSASHLWLPLQPSPFPSFVRVCRRQHPLIAPAPPSSARRAKPEYAAAARPTPAASARRPAMPLSAARLVRDAHPPPRP